MNSSRSATSQPVWRSLLYVPAHVGRFVSSAVDCRADAVLLDLEDSVPVEAKDDARAALPAACARLKEAGHDVLVRVNGPLQWLVPDLEAAVAANVDGVAVPKVLGASHLEAICELLDSLERIHDIAPGKTRIVAMIETPRAFQAMAAICRVSPRLVGVMLGGGDFALHCGSRASADVLRLPKQLMVIAARAAGILPFGLLGTPDDLSNLEAFERMARESADFGFVGATCIHPKQVDALNRAFMPSVAEVEAAREVIDAYDKARAAGRGAVRVGSKMIDLPVFELAQRTVQRYEAVTRAPHAA